MNRYSTGRRGKTADREAAARYTALLTADLPRTLSPRQAWYLSGGVMGRTDGNEPDRPGIPLAAVAKRVPDCLHFVPDLRAHLQETAA